MTEEDLKDAALRFIRTDKDIHAKFQTFLDHEKEGMPEYGIDFQNYHHDGEDAFLAITKEEFDLLKPHEHDLMRGNIPAALYAVEEGDFVDRCMENMTREGIPVGFTGELIEWALV